MGAIDMSKLAELADPMTVARAQKDPEVRDVMRAAAWAGNAALLCSSPSSISLIPPPPAPAANSSTRR
jgi:hypothetical protein